MPTPFHLVWLVADPPVTTWPYVATLERVLLALALGLFLGLERERRGKEAGLRTFAFAALLGCLGGLEGAAYSLLMLALLGVLITFLNIQTLRAHNETELTTSAALLVTGFAGVLCGQGHTFTPVSVEVATAALLAWKTPLAAFSIGLSEAELRSAILLAILAFVVYPVLPTGALDPWGVVEPRTAWLTVLLIASIGFANYVLLKLYGARGAEVAGFLGGLVNSTVVVTELAQRVRETDGGLLDEAYRGVMLSVVAMVVRNAVLLAILATTALPAIALSLVLMLIVSLVLAVGQLRPRHQPVRSATTIHLNSPFSLTSVLKFGAVFVGLQIGGAAAQSVLGGLGFYAVSIVGGFVSSASAVASAGTLAAQGTISPGAAGVGAILASLASTLIDLPLVARTARESRLTRRLAWSLALVVLVGVGGALLQPLVIPNATLQHLVAR